MDYFSYKKFPDKNNGFKNLEKSGRIATLENFNNLANFRIPILNVLYVWCKESKITKSKLYQTTRYLLSVLVIRCCSLLVCANHNSRIPHHTDIELIFKL